MLGKANQNPFEILFEKFSRIDIAYSLFSISTWNNNRASNDKILYLYRHFLSTKKFADKNKISNYCDFLELYRSIDKLLSSLRFQGFFAPEEDWGQIKFPFEGNNYKIAYGSDIYYPYDSLQGFELIYKSISREIENLTGQSPMGQMEEMLKLSDYVITSLDKHQISDEKRIKPLHIEPPSIEYWQSCINFLFQFNSKEFSKNFRYRFVINIGDLPCCYRDISDSLREKDSGNLFNIMLINVGESTLPISPRWMIEALVNSWSKTYKKVHSKLKTRVLPTELEIGRQVGIFAKRRVLEESVSLLVSVTNRKKEHDDFIFPFVVRSKNYVCFFCLVPPLMRKEAVKNKLENIHNGIKSAKIKLKDEILLYLNSDKKTILLKYNGGTKINLRFIVLVPNLPIENSWSHGLEEANTEVIYLREFLGILDEIDNSDEFSDFFNFLDSIRSNKIFPLNSYLDYYAAFKNFDGVLSDSGTDPIIFLDPNCGDDYRYKSLKGFWPLCEKIPYLKDKDPRSWKISQETPTRFCFVSKYIRNHQGLAFYIGNSSVQITSPYPLMDMGTTTITANVSYCIEDYLSELNPILKNHKFFSLFKKVDIFVIPKDLIKKNQKNLGHLIHLHKCARPISIDHNISKPEYATVRLVFEDSILTETKNRSHEMKILSSLIERFEKIVPDREIFMQLKAEIINSQSEKPRYVIYDKQKKVSFPEGISPCKPDLKHFKLANKFIAETINRIGLSEGLYELNKSKEIVDGLIKQVSEKISSEIKRYNFQKSTVFILERMGALFDENERNLLKHRSTREREIDYNLEDAMTEDEILFIAMNRNYRYLIEKFIHLQPHGEKEIDDEGFKSLVAVIGCLYQLVNISSEIHYNIFPGKIRIDDEFRLLLVDTDKKKKVSNNFFKYRLGINEELVGRKEVKIHSHRNNLNSVDDVFIKNLMFKFTDLIGVLQGMQIWGYIKKSVKASYKENIDEIIRICCERIPSSSKESIINSIDFLKLKKENICRITGEESQHEEIPIWEHYKRHTRYTIRPLIEIDKYIYWDPYSVRQSELIWTRNIQAGVLPVNLENSEIEKCLQREKSSQEKNLEEVASEITERFTDKCEKNVDLYKRDKSAGYPKNLGDYDILAYIKGSDALISIECKHLKQVYSAKAVKRLREQMFGKKSIQEGYVGKVLNRHNFLVKNWSKIFKTLLWEPQKSPKIYSIFCSIYPYIWGYSPPIDNIPIEFMVVTELDEYLRSIKGKSATISHE